MRSRKVQVLSAAVIALTIFLSTANAGSTEKVLFSFDGTNGSGPNSSVIFDRAGNLYGTASGGGAHGYGVVFKLSPNANGTWTETVLHNFNGTTDGGNPSGALIWDKAGNLYGTATSGGIGDGTVFELSPGSNGDWTWKVIFTLFGPTEGAEPIGSLAFDAQGNLYGTTWEGGDYSAQCLYGCGTVFKLTPGSKGEWTGSALIRFNGVNGSSPYSNVIFDAQGNVYGTSSGAWSTGGYNGNIFELIPGSNGEWTEKILYTFRGGDDLITSGLVFDNAGNLYGTTWEGGAHAVGTIFKLTPNADGAWTETILHNFNGSDGAWVYAGVVPDSKGNLWGTTSGYGGDFGTVYELVNANGQWNINVLRTFSNDEVDGGVTFDAEGNIYSTAALGGSKNCQGGCGMVFKVIP